MYTCILIISLLYKVYIEGGRMVAKLAFGLVDPTYQDLTIPV